MRAFAKRIAGDVRAQDSAEYGIALAVIGVVAISTAVMIGTKVGGLWDPVDSVISVVHGQGNNGNHGDGNNGNHGSGNNGNGKGNG